MTVFALVYVTRRLESLTREEFLDHYHRVHHPLALRLPGLISYEQMPITRDGYLGGIAPAGHDAVSRYTFASSEAAEAAFASPAGIALNEDTGLFMDWPTVITLPVTITDLPAAPTARAGTDTSRTLRLVWPQWQGAAADNVADLAPELPYEAARRGYATGATTLNTVLPAHDVMTAHVPVDLSDDGTTQRDGIEAKDAVIRQLSSALSIIREHEPERIVTLGGECSVSVAPFTALANRYDGDVAVVWIDSHPDVGTPTSEYPGYHAMAVSHIVGRGDPEVQALLPATIDPGLVALAGLHSWTDDDYPHVADWGISAFSPDQLRDSSDPVLAWLASTGCSRVAIHLDVDVVDSDEVVLGLGAEPGGLRTTEVRRLIRDIHENFEVVALTVAEYMPRQVLQAEALLRGLPLL